MDPCSDFVNDNEAFKNSDLRTFDFFLCLRCVNVVDVGWIQNSNSLKPEI